MLKVKCLVTALWEIQMSGQVEKPRDPSNTNSSMQIHQFYWGPSRASKNWRFVSALRAHDDEALPQHP